MRLLVIVYVYDMSSASQASDGTHASHWHPDKYEYKFELRVFASRHALHFGPRPSDGVL
jgi:hypothetical protein